MINRIRSSIAIVSFALALATIARAETVKDGPSRVSENGEVIFLYKASAKLQQKLIAQAFEIRLARSAAPG